MAKELDSSSKGIIEFRPQIGFVEPEQEDFVILPKPEVPTTEDTLAERQKLKFLADAVSLMAELTQARIDDKAKNMRIRLDPTVDALAMQAMKRQYPDQDSGYITFGQYKAARDKIRQHALEVADKPLTTKADIELARQNMNNIGGLGTEAATDGSLRPELDKKSQIIEPLNMTEFQNELLKILINVLWKRFIKPALQVLFASLGATAPLALALPDELVPISEKGKKVVDDLAKIVGF